MSALPIREPQADLAAALCRRVFQRRTLALYTRGDRQYVVRGINRDWLPIAAGQKSWSAR